MRVVRSDLCPFKAYSSHRISENKLIENLYTQNVELKSDSGASWEPANNLFGAAWEMPSECSLPLYTNTTSYCLLGGVIVDPCAACI